MKTQIRRGAFETNSSSTHTLSVYNTERWNEFKNGGMYIDTYKGGFCTREELEERYKAEAADLEAYPIEDWMNDEGIFDWDSYSDMYEILEEDIDSASVTAVSIYGWE